MAVTCLHWQPYGQQTVPTSSAMAVPPRTMTSTLSSSSYTRPGEKSTRTTSLPVAVSSGVKSWPRFTKAA